MRRLVIVESPYAGYLDRNIEYGQKCMADCLKRNEAPFASHLLYTQDNVLDGTIKHERELGIMAGHQWMRRADAVVVYCDYGLSSGMIEGIKRAAAIGIPVEYRRLFSQETGEAEQLELAVNGD